MVPQDFGDDRGHGNLGDEGVAVDDSDYRTSECLVDAKGSVAVNTEFEFEPESSENISNLSHGLHCLFLFQKQILQD